LKALARGDNRLQVGIASFASAPRNHPSHSVLHGRMDCRIKSGNDEKEKVNE
jgi:hypothetical protein